MAMASARLRMSQSSAATSAFATAVERKIGLTVTGVTLVLLAILGFGLARKIGNPPLYLLAYGLLFIVATAFVLGRRRLSVDADRTDLPRRVREGQVVEVELGLRARRRVTTILLQEEMHPHLGRTVSVPVPNLPPGEEVRHPYTFSPRLRGVYTVGPLVASWTDPFGLTRKRVVLADPIEIIVHPTTELVHDRVLSRAWEDPPIRPPVSKPWPTGFEFYGMQDYQQGDDPRSIVWRATARTLDVESGTGRYLVRIAEQGITDRVSLILDTDVEWHSPGEVSETFETAVRVVASIGAKHLKDGFAVTVERNADQMVKSLRGPAKRIDLLDQLARVRPDKTPLHDALTRMMLNPARDTHVVIVTPFLSNEAARRIRLLMNRGVSVLLALVMWDDSEPESMHRAGSLGCNVVEVNARAPLQVVFSRVMAGGRR